MNHVTVSSILLLITISPLLHIQCLSEFNISTPELSGQDNSDYGGRDPHADNASICKSWH
jgi:hypothetical protein